MSVQQHAGRDVVREVAILPGLLELKRKLAFVGGGCRSDFKQFGPTAKRAGNPQVRLPVNRLGRVLVIAAGEAHPGELFAGFQIAQHQRILQVTDDGFAAADRDRIGGCVAG